MVDELKHQGITATVIPFVVGSFGSWYPPNGSFLWKFCAKSYINMFRKLCVSDTIRWSRDIYIEHLTGHRQFTEGDMPLDSQSADRTDE
ncbi:retrovirus-related Pol polyprotein from type-1 retrotransposable element R2 [Caerostris extrusa]|uniref:Retrovirus-related Pol polyprotein from type-1 retrotransposable element R2 n=1 Tax=Caerostris extrusa TaxID=172846 RepID=A0AAV4TWW9_CAEEX|nr:retrovirus-related Pol polyprotein from type-1 retrotransposable element R2 [Caerostris extrusa]